MAPVTGIALVLALGFAPVGLLWVAVRRRTVDLAGVVGIADRLHRRHDLPPPRRPLEAVVADARRLGARHHTLHPHASFAKVRAVQAAYDRVLGELCAALEVPHLLGVLEPGPDLDRERVRVEVRLAASGLELPDAA